MTHHVKRDDILERDTAGLVFCDEDLVDLDWAASRGEAEDEGLV